MITLAVWLLALPFRIAFRLGFRGTVVLACLLVLAVTTYGIATDLGLLDPPAHASPTRKPRKPTRKPAASSAAKADIQARLTVVVRTAEETMEAHPTVASRNVF